LIKCNIVIPHVSYDSLMYLKTCVSQIKKHKHTLVKQKILIVDQSPPHVFDKIKHFFSSDPEVEIFQLERVDAGYPIDFIARNLSEDSNDSFLCSLDSDAFPISNLWLYLPIKLIETFGYSFVGSSTNLAKCYYDYTRSFGYDKEWVHINNYYRISRVSVAKLLSNSVGFMRPGNRDRVGFKAITNQWGERGFDNGVIANWYADYLKLGDKFSFNINSALGYTDILGVFGMNISDLVFHFVFGFGEDTLPGGSYECLGFDYLKLRSKIINQDILSSEFIEDLLKQLKPLRPDHALEVNHLPDPANSVINFINQIKNENI